MLVYIGYSSAFIMLSNYSCGYIKVSCCHMIIRTEASVEDSGVTLCRLLFQANACALQPLWDLAAKGLHCFFPDMCSQLNWSFCAWERVLPLTHSLSSPQPKGLTWWDRGHFPCKKSSQLCGAVQALGFHWDKLMLVCSSSAVFSCHIPLFSLALSRAVSL